MKNLKTILRNLRLFDRSKAYEHEIDEELRFHLDMRAQDNRENGMTAEEAQADAMRRFGNYEDVKAECRKISKERLEGVMNLKVFKGIIWVLIGCGLMLQLTDGINGTRSAGLGLILLGVLCRLMIFLKEEMAEVDSKINKGIIWFLLGCGLTLQLSSRPHIVAIIGQFLIFIGILWRVLIHLRKMRPDQQRIKAAEQLMLSIPGVDITASEHYTIEEPLRPVPPHDQNGRTPVERLISDEE